MRFRLAIEGALIALVLLATPVAAQAGTIDVYSCKLPNAAPAPANGWQAFANFSAVVGGSPTRSNCGQQYGLLDVFNAPSQPGREAGWRFDAPAGETIAGVQLQHWASGFGNGANGTLYYDLAFDSWPPPAAGDPDGEWCHPDPTPGACERGDDEVHLPEPRPEFERTGLRHTRMFLGLRCVGANPCFDTGLQFYGGPGLQVYYARVTLEDVLPPRFERAPSVSADGAHVTFSASDQGAGLSQLDLTVDGNLAGRQSLSDVQASCRPPFVDPVPCPLARDGVFDLDVSGLADGDHELRAKATDIAGNSSISAPLTITTHGGRLVVAVPADPVGDVTPLPAPAPRAALLSAWFAGKTRALEATVDYRHHGTVDGTLTDAAGASLAGATLQVLDGQAKRTAKTDAKGRFTYHPVAGPTRTIEFSYGSVLTRVTLRVRAGVTLKTSTGTVRNGTRLRFTGRVLGERTRRALVTIFALRDGPQSRSTVATVRSKTDGRFAYTYTFKALTRRTTFRFEARVVKQTGLPYEEGASPRVTVKGRP